MKQCAVLGFAAFSGTGKTTLLKKVIPLLIQKGIKLAVIKYSHHDIELDTPGKDSYELRHAGATQTLLATPGRWSLITETPDKKEPLLTEMLGKLDQQHLDLVLVEGFRDAEIAKIELHRSEMNKPLLHTTDQHFIALATDESGHEKAGIPQLDINNPVMIAEFIQHWMKQQ